MPSSALESATFAVKHYDLAATLSCGQAFRWRQNGGAWEGVIGSRWVRLRQNEEGIVAATINAEDWQWLRHYLQLEVDLEAIVATFPQDGPMREAAARCRGLRLLRQNPWECLASFVCSSTKQIVQIEQIVSLLSSRFGEAVAAEEGVAPVFSFPAIEKIAGATEAELRECNSVFARLTFWARRMLASGKVDLSRLSQLPLEEARMILLDLPGWA